MIRDCVEGLDIVLSDDSFTNTIIKIGRIIRMKKLIMLFAVVTVIVLMSTSVMAYGQEETATISGVNVKISNTIGSDKRSSSATTWTSSPSPVASVSATFYWEDYNELKFGSNHKTGGHTGSYSVYADPVMGAIYYYKVESAHSVTYNGSIYNFRNLVTFVP